jgi:aspartate carbamoyltransferase regulatory subunit
VVAPKSELQPVPGKGPCRNQQCITTTEPVEPAFVQAENGPVICAYCEEEQTEH